MKKWFHSEAGRPAGALPLAVVLVVAGMFAAWAQTYREIPSGLKVGGGSGSTGVTIEANGDIDADGDITANAFVGDGSGLTGISGAAHTIEDEGTPLTARSKLNFVGSGVTVTDDSGDDATDVTISSGGDALTSNPLSQFAATTSAELAGVLSDETGSGGGFVRATSPTLTTPALGTPSSLTLTNATGLPVAGGGTGASTFTDAGVLIGNGTGAVQVTGAGTSGQVLTSNGAGVDPTFQDAAGGGDVSDGDTLSTGLTFPNTGLHVLDTNASHDLILSTDEDMSTDNTLQFNVSGASKKLTLTANATIGGTNTGDVSLAGTPDYITISGQTITRGSIDLGADVTGSLPDGNVSDTLTASLFVGSGSSTTAVDLATEEVSGDLAASNFVQGAQSTLFGRAAGAGTGDGSYLAHLAIQTLLNNPSGVTSTSNSVAWNSDNARIFTHTLTQNTTIAASSGTPFDGQIVLFVITQAAGSYTLAWNSQFAAGEDFSDTIPAMSTTNGNVDFYLFFYSSGKTKFILLDQMAY